MMGMTQLTDRAAPHRMTRAEFETWRDSVDGRSDRNRYELLDGEIVVTPSPTPLHQHVLRRLMHRLEFSLPEDLAMLPAPIDLRLSTRDGDTVLQPDLLIARWANPSTKSSLGEIQLVVEILSPTTWQRDLGVKRITYAETGIGHYWAVAPSVPSMTVYHLGPGGDYIEAAHVEGDQVARVTEPVPLELRPTDLVR